MELLLPFILFLATYRSRLMDFSLFWFVNILLLLLKEKNVNFSPLSPKPRQGVWAELGGGGADGGGGVA